MSIYKGNRVVAGTYPLYGTTGESTAGPMTQKATTDALSEKADVDLANTTN